MLVAMAKVLVPLPDRDFDVTEVAVPWKLLVEAGHDVVFGKLGARPEAIAFYRELERDPAFLSPVPWAACDAMLIDALFLAGGHAPGMKQYLGSAALHAQIAAFWATGRPVGAICHGVLVLARAQDPATGVSVLAGATTTCLPKYMERSAYLLTFWKLGRYYRTYPAYVEDEVKAALADPETQFVRGPRTMTKRGTADDDSPAFVVEDGRYVSARWPGDAYKFARTFLSRLR